MQCSECRHYKKDTEYSGLGSCSSDEVTGRLVFGNADYFLIADDFGCRFAEGTEQPLQPDILTGAG